jgi:hypothetical protein
MKLSLMRIYEKILKIQEAIAHKAEEQKESFDKNVRKEMEVALKDTKMKPCFKFKTDDFEKLKLIFLSFQRIAGIIYFWNIPTAKAVITISFNSLLREGRVYSSHPKKAQEYVEELFKNYSITIQTPDS